MGNFIATIFRSKKDTATERTIEKRSWSKFVKFLSDLSELEYTKQTAPLISPAIYKPGTTRSNANVEAWAGWCAIDIDKHPFKTRTDIESYMKKSHKDKGYVCYSTARSSKEHPKFRLIFQLDEWIKERQTIQKFWFSLNKELNEFVDKQTKDVSRMFYIPAKYTESTNSFFWSVEGNPISPFYLIKKHKADEFFAPSGGSSFLDLIPEKMKESVINYRQNQLKANGKYYSWTSYKDCPFVKKESIEEYRSIVLTQADGRYRHLYQLMVSIAAVAVLKQYPITSGEVQDLVLQIDNDIDGYYKTRKIHVEAERAIAFVYRNHNSF